MASKTSAAKKKTAATTDSMKAIVEATLAGSFVYTSVADHTPLVSDGLVEVNSAMSDASGALATRATQKGIDSMKSQPQTQLAANQNASDGNTGVQLAGQQEFVIQDNIPIPAVAGRGRTGQSTYPFDRLNIGQSFFVPKASKNLASTVSSANARFSEEIPGQTKTDRKGNVVPATKQLRQFVVRTVTENGVKGSRIWRVEPKA